MDAGYGNIFNVQRTTELYVTAGVAAAHLEDQVLPKRCGHIGGKALVPATEMIGKLRMMRAVADDLGNEDFVVIARTDGLSAIDAPRAGARDGPRGRSRPALPRQRHPGPALVRVPDLRPRSPSRPSPPRSASASRRRASPSTGRSSFKWFNDPDPLTFAELGELGVGFIFITLGGQHANGYGLSTLLSAMAERQEQGYIELQRRSGTPTSDFPTRSHHQFSGVPYHHLVGKAYDAARLGVGVRRGAPGGQGRLTPSRMGGTTHRDRRQMAWLG